MKREKCLNGVFFLEHQTKLNSFIDPTTLQKATIPLVSYCSVGVSWKGRMNRTSNKKIAIRLENLCVRKISKTKTWYKRNQVNRYKASHSSYLLKIGL